MQQDGFRFSHDKRFRRVSYKEFLATAQALSKTVSEHRQDLTVNILTAEDHTTYDYTTVTFDTDEVHEVLRGRKHYTLSELTPTVWNRAFDVQVTLYDKKDEQPFMISLSCDRYADDKRMLFYGQCLDEAVLHAVLNQFRRRALWYGLGDGVSPCSTFNMLVGAHLAGTRLSL